ncbi:MAG: fasciclin domain-containing protein [Prevotellaceae bacterium]|jgi:uncharacterized surface protein with fasciclin (FAS1) repeats|nr:fasciclin domain-containing protein [Prevotellaceae bacterium]
MKNYLHKFLLLLLLFPVAQCQRERDEYYAAPEWGRKPVYEELQEQGRFGLYLQCVERTMYAASLKGNGLWTVFAPNDDAVKAYLTSKGYGAVEDIPQSEVEKIVAYSMLYDRYEFDRLTDILSNGWDTLSSVKKRTPYYETIHREYDEVRQDSVWVVSPTIAAAGTIGYTTNDNNYKYLPFYLSRYFGARQTPLTAADYNTFYPNSTYTGKNVQGASVVKQDMLSSNGVAHEIDGVNEPLPNLEDILFGDPQYSSFRELIELKNPLKEPLFYGYYTSLFVTQYFQTMYPLRNLGSVYIKAYPALDVPINCERFFNPLDEVSPESEGYTIFAPNNTAVEKFYNEKIRDYGYSSLSELPVELVQDFINAHMVSNMIWPGEYRGAKNGSGAYINGEGPAGAGYEGVCTDIRPASNGFFYGSNAYVKSPSFETVLTEVILRPNTYGYFYEALRKYFSATLLQELLYCPLNGYDEEDYIVLLPSDEALKADGFTYESDAFDFKGLGATVTDTRMRRLVRSHVFKRLNASAAADTRFKFDEQGPLLNDYGGYSYALNDNGDMIRYKDSRVQMVGNCDRNEWVTVTPVKQFLNGTVYTIDALLQYSSNDDYTDGELTDYLTAAKANSNNPNISKAVDYMLFFAENEKQKYTLSKESMWTVLLPANNAIDSAIAHGYIYDLANIRSLVNDIDPSLVSIGEERLNQAINFFRYHIIPGTLYIDDGYSKVLSAAGTAMDFAVTTTNLKVELINSTFLKVEKDGGKLRFSTEKSTPFQSVSVVRGEKRSNLFAPRTVVHEIDGYLIHESEVN